MNELMSRKRNQFSLVFTYFDDYHFKLPVCIAPKEISLPFDGTGSGLSTKAPMKTSGDGEWFFLPSKLCQEWTKVEYAQRGEIPP